MTLGKRAQLENTEEQCQKQGVNRKWTGTVSMAGKVLAHVRNQKKGCRGKKRYEPKAKERIITRGRKKKNNQDRMTTTGDKTKVRAQRMGSRGQILTHKRGGQMWGT